MDQAQAVQDRLDVLQMEMHTKVEACFAKYNEEKNAIFSARRAVIADLIAKKEIPADFWALALIHLLQKRDRESTTMPHFLGPYDEQLLRTYLEEIQVVYTDKGHKITLRFKPNPFFEEEELWAESISALKEVEDAADMPPVGARWNFSGVSWKDGHGPKIDDDDDEEDDEEEDDEAPGKKRAHTGSSSANDGASMHGPSVLEVFTEMPEHPDEDEEFDEEDDDALADAVDEWEAEMDDRKTLLLLIEVDVHQNPVEAIKEEQEEAANGEDGEAASKKAKTE